MVVKIRKKYTAYCPYSELFWSTFSRIRTKYGDISISPYSVWMREDAHQNNSEYGHFLLSGNKKSSERLRLLGITIVKDGLLCKRSSLKPRKRISKCFLNCLFSSNPINLENWFISNLYEESKDLFDFLYVLFGLVWLAISKYDWIWPESQENSNVSQIGLAVLKKVWNEVLMHFIPT